MNLLHLHLFHPTPSDSIDLLDMLDISEATDRSEIQMTRLYCDAQVISILHVCRDMILM